MDFSGRRVQVQPPHNKPRGRIKGFDPKLGARIKTAWWSCLVILRRPRRAYTSLEDRVLHDREDVLAVPQEHISTDAAPRKSKLQLFILDRNL